MSIVCALGIVVLAILRKGVSADIETKYGGSSIADYLDISDISQIPLTATIPLYDCTHTHRPKYGDLKQYQIYHNDKWWTQTCPEDVVWNQKKCRCSYPDGSDPLLACRDYRTSSDGQAGKYEQFVNSKWIVRDCSLGVAGLIWDQATCQCVWNPDSDKSGQLIANRIKPCDIMLNMTFEDGVKDSAKGSFIEVGRGVPMTAEAIARNGKRDNMAAYFYNTALNVWFFSNNELGTSLRVEFKFKMEENHDSRDSYQILISNGCNVSVPGFTTPSVAIGYRPSDQSYLLAFETTSARKAIVCSQKHEAYDWHTVSLIYEDGTLLLRIDGKPCIISQDFNGHVQKTSCPLSIGADPLERESMYNGYMDDIIIARYCHNFGSDKNQKEVDDYVEEPDSYNSGPMIVEPASTNYKSRSQMSQGYSHKQRSSNRSRKPRRDKPVDYYYYVDDIDNDRSQVKEQGQEKKEEYWNKNKYDHKSQEKDRESVRDYDDEESDGKNYEDRYNTGNEKKNSRTNGNDMNTKFDNDEKDDASEDSTFIADKDGKKDGVKSGEAKTYWWENGENEEDVDNYDEKEELRKDSDEKSFKKTNDNDDDNRDNVRNANSKILEEREETMPINNQQDNGDKSNNDFQNYDEYDSAENEGKGNAFYDDYEESNKPREKEKEEEEEEKDNKEYNDQKGKRTGADYDEAAPIKKTVSDSKAPKYKQDNSGYNGDSNIYDDEYSMKTQNIQKGEDYDYYDDNSDDGKENTETRKDERGSGNKRRGGKKSGRGTRNGLETGGRTYSQRDMDRMESAEGGMVDLILDTRRDYDDIEMGRTTKNNNNNNNDNNNNNNKDIQSNNRKRSGFGGEREGGSRIDNNNSRRMRQGRQNGGQTTRKSKPALMDVVRGKKDRMNPEAVDSRSSQDRPSSRRRNYERSHRQQQRSSSSKVGRHQRYRHVKT